VEYLEAVASLRYGLSLTSNFISKCYQNEDYFKELQPVERHALDCLFGEVKRVCLLGCHTQPHEFLMKFIVRQFGMQFLKQLVDKPNFDWLIPPELQPARNVRMHQYVLICQIIQQSLHRKTTLQLIHMYSMVKVTKVSVKPLLYLFVAQTLPNWMLKLKYDKINDQFYVIAFSLQQLSKADSIVISLALYQQILFQGKDVTSEVTIYICLSSVFIRGFVFLFCTHKDMYKKKFHCFHIYHEPQ